MAAAPSSLRAMEALRGQRRAVWLGLMSGTSCDGIDAARVEVEEAPNGLPRLLSVEGCTRAFAEEERTHLLADLAGGPDAACCARWDAILAERFAEATFEATARFGPAAAIALSGHTFAHLPRGDPPSTLQLGDPARVAQRTGLPVVAGFRACDVARGGEGAPLVPAGDRILFGRADAPVAVVNLGGITNVTWLPPAWGPPRARDCGPGNVVLDHLMALGSGGRLAIDRGGAAALRGTARSELVDRWLRHPFFEGGRRSTGREELGEAWIEERRRELGTLDLSDRLATAARWIAAAVARGVERLAEGAVAAEILLAGGGVHHRGLLAELQEALDPPPRVLDPEVDGVSADLREAAAFALLGHEWLHGRPGSFPTTTGCREGSPLGALW